MIQHSMEHKKLWIRLRRINPHPLPPVNQGFRHDAMMEDENVEIHHDAANNPAHVNLHLLLMKLT